MGVLFAEVNDLLFQVYTYFLTSALSGIFSRKYLLYSQDWLRNWYPRTLWLIRISYCDCLLHLNRFTVFEGTFSMLTHLVKAYFDIHMDEE